MPEDTLIKLKSYAAMRGVSVKTARRWVAKGAIDAYRPGAGQMHGGAGIGGPYSLTSVSVPRSILDLAEPMQAAGEGPNTQALGTESDATSHRAPRRYLPGPSLTDRRCQT